MSFMDSQIFTMAIVPALIFFSRITDVTIGTMRIIYVARGMRLIAAICGFFEVMIWLVAITQIMKELNNIIMYLAYAGGFATGNYVGILLEEKLAVGMVAVRIITIEDATKLINELRSKRYGVTVMAARGLSGRVRLVFSIVKRKDLKDVVNMVKAFNPKAFFSIEDIRAVSEGTFPAHLLKPTRHLAGIRGIGKWK
jgi:uncharacterized protein YebE (UPF0316 family)